MTFSLFRAFDAFQLTPSRRATMTSSSFSELFCISTHALTEGDIAVGTEVTQTSIFQLTPSRRATPFWNRQGFMHQHFNSRPHGGRHFLIYLLRLLYHFNSRPHGGRHALTRRLNFSLVFQLTPSRRATIHYRRFDHINIISTHALTEGDEDLDTILPPCIAISTHALTEGDINSADTFFK